MLLYDSAVSGNCYKVRLICAHLGLPLERHELSVTDRSDRPALIGDLNPALRVPTLVLDDGRALGESDAIIWYLARGTEYVPTDDFELAQVLQWLFFEQYQHEPNVAVARFMLHYSDDPERYAPLVAERQRAGYVSLDAMEKHLTGRTFLVGERYTIADIALYAYTHVADEGGFDLGRYPAIQAWLARVAAQPRHITIDA
jgi:glutathione S-transferase